MRLIAVCDLRYIRPSAGGWCTIRANPSRKDWLVPSVDKSVSGWKARAFLTGGAHSRPAGVTGRARLPPAVDRCRGRRVVATCEVKVSEQPATAVFQARGVTKTYRMGEVEVQALRGVDLDLSPGEFVVILGPSGSGKSTLLNILGGLDTPSSGTVLYRHHDLTAADEDELTNYRREHVGFVFQFYNLIGGLTAFENVELVADIAPHPLPPAEALRLVGLTERSDHYPAQLSGGEQQRVAIARAIVKRPDVLLCDEPTGALDVKTGVIVLEAIARINEELGTLTAVITHNAAIAEMADRTIRLLDGRIADVATNAHRKRAQEIVW